MCSWKVIIFNSLSMSQTPCGNAPLKWGWQFSSIKKKHNRIHLTHYKCLTPTTTNDTQLGTSFGRSESKSYVAWQYYLPVNFVHTQFVLTEIFLSGVFYIKWPCNILLIIFPCRMLGDLYTGNVKPLFSVFKVVLAKGAPPHTQSRKK